MSCIMSSLLMTHLGLTIWMKVPAEQNYLYYMQRMGVSLSFPMVFLHNAWGISRMNYAMGRPTKKYVRFEAPWNPTVLLQTNKAKKKLVFSSVPIISVLPILVSPMYFINRGCYRGNSVVRWLPSASYPFSQ